MSAPRRFNTLNGVSQLTAVGNNLFFSATDDTTGSELWKTDGINTNRVADIRPGPLGSSPYQLTAVGQALFFEAFDDTSGGELWTTDGTTTNRVADLRPGSYSSRLANLTAVGSTLFFVATDGNSGSEVWTSDGTTTRRVADLYSGYLGSIGFFIVPSTIPLPWGTSYSFRPQTVLQVSSSGKQTGSRPVLLPTSTQGTKQARCPIPSRLLAALFSLSPVTSQPAVRSGKQTGWSPVV